MAPFNAHIGLRNPAAVTTVVRVTPADRGPGITDLVAEAADADLQPLEFGG
jgi:hypothetical protein